MGHVKDYFTDRGLVASDIPKAIIFHEVISIAFAAFTWSAMFGLQPSVSLSRPLAKLPLAGKAAGLFEKALVFSDKKVAAMGWLKKIPIIKNANPRRLTVSLAESLVFRGAIKPITFGGKLYMSYMFVRMGKDKMKNRPACVTLSLPAPRGLGISSSEGAR
mmetsp:Transcript_9949/g.24534  ORF Transcript_9949/g.24534 Transcript_9949/m.24534 type:complete len:161 (-) Transcript_9949:92-574(-)|eukprot:CAMPEP_0197593766 /NCGR_PEP_ID=MMETSP1326-20131121/19001_1 /TAXON_ID=1155430 /ORGANISM="Genus nov. species nov., Strain RCC2288" /LENGTH=160 /DNA_ID=CAMNT_0043159805 /DNA_START=137 /DNA_END=619 /DNA_ORIENTATION=+